jgi:dUTPase
MSSPNLRSGYELYLVIDDADLAVQRNYDYADCALSADNAGVDLLTAETWLGTLAETAHLLNLGVRAMLVKSSTLEPVHYLLLPRSSIYKTGHMMANSVGVIDSSYRGVLKAPVIRTAENAPGFLKYDRHFQIVAPDMGHIHTIHRVSSLSQTLRGNGGFGSTG